MMKPKVSIIVPIYNVEKYLDRCMESLLRQTLKEIEIILVDDESPDNCPKLCDDYASKYDLVKVVHKKNEGLGMACNSGLEIAVGEYVAWCDSDDYVDEYMYQSLYENAIKYKADVVLSGIKTVNDTGVVKPMSQPKEFKVIKEKKDIDAYVLDMIASEPSAKEERKVPMSAKINLYRRSLIREHDLHFVSERMFICEDLLWNMDVLAHSACIVTIPQSYYYYYNNTNSLSRKIRTDRFSLFKSIHTEIIRRAKGLGIIGDIDLRADRMFIGYCRFYIGQLCKSALTIEEKKKIVSDICLDAVFLKICDNFPVSKLPLQYRIVTNAMKKNSFNIISLIYKFKR